MKTFIAAGLLAGLALTGCASAAAPDDSSAPGVRPAASRACFFSRQISGWRSESDEETVYLNVGVKDVYRLDMFGRCNGVDEAITIGVVTRGGGSSICDGLDVILLVQSPIGPSRCPVTKVVKLTSEEIEAIPGTRSRSPEKAQ